MIVRVWGARGSLSAPGPATVGYGGNTSCVEVELADGTILILDAGSGIRELGQRLLEREHGTVYICLTHLHLDHVEGLGFFAPLWRAGWELKFWGPPSTTATLRERVSRYLSPQLFPVCLSEAPAEATHTWISGIFPQAAWYSRSSVALNGSTESLRTKFTVEPPNPPPVIRAPSTPGTRIAASTRKSSSAALTS